MTSSENFASGITPKVTPPPTDTHTCLGALRPCLSLLRPRTANAVCAAGRCGGESRLA